MNHFLVRHAPVILCCIAAIICSIMYACSTRYYVHVSDGPRYHRETVLDRWTGKTVEK